MGITSENDLSNAISPGDLVTWKWEETKNGIPVGLLGEKLEPTLNVEEGKFKVEDLNKALQERISNNTRDTLWRWKYEIDTFINARFAESEIFEDSENIYISTTIRGSDLITIGWSKLSKRWVVPVTDITKSTKPSSARRFNEAVFPDDSTETYKEKQNLKEFFTVGIGLRQAKQIHVKVDGTERVLLLSAQEWNNMVVGNECEATKIQVVPWDNDSQMKQLEFQIRATTGHAVEIEQVDPSWEIKPKTIFHGSTKDLRGYYSDPIREGNL